MKRFTKLLSIISSILGVLTLTLGISLGVFDKPRTISKVSAGDLPTDVYLDNVYTCSDKIDISNSNTNYTFNFNSYCTYLVYVYTNANSGFDFYVGSFDFTNPVYSVKSLDGLSFYRLGVFTGFYFFEDDFFYIGNYRSNIVDVAQFNLVLNFTIGPRFYDNVKLNYAVNDSITSLLTFTSEDFVYGFNIATPISASSYNNNYQVYVNSLSNESTGYDLGFDLGYKNGLDNGVNSVINNPNDYQLYNYSQYSTYGVEQFNAGVSYASSNDLNFYDFLTTLFKAPTSMFSGIWNWSLPLGNGTSLNLLPLMTFLLTIAIALAVIKLILGGK